MVNKTAKLHDIENEPNEIVYAKMADAMSIMRTMSEEAPKQSLFIRRGTQLDLYALCHAFEYALAFQALVGAEHDPNELEELRKADIRAWQHAMAGAVLAVRAVPPMGIGARENHDWSRFTKAGFLAQQMSWRLLNTILHRPSGTPWPDPKDAMRTVVIDYMSTVIRYGRTYEDANDYTGEQWFDADGRHTMLVYSIDPALLGRCEKCPVSKELMMVDPGFSKHLEMVFSVEPDPAARVELIKQTWNVETKTTNVPQYPPSNIALDY